MSRTVSWRRSCTSEVQARIEESLHSTLYILNEIGPTGFVVKQDNAGIDKKFKVFLGDPHSCTCSQFRKDKELCVHLLWILLKKFRMSKDNPLVFQRGLVEREIQELLSGRLKYQSPNRQRPSSSGGCSNENILEQRALSLEDTCPICQELLTEKSQRLTYCKYGCGNSVHLRCIKMWADHQKTQNETTHITCPLCREKFSTFQELYEEAHSKRQVVNTGREALHLGVTCCNCDVCPIAGKCFKCETCLNYFLCQNCFKLNPHSAHHSFLFKQHPNHLWRSHQSNTILPVPTSSLTLMDELQNRELTENDYELLLNLDTTPPTHLTTAGVPPSSSPAHITSSNQVLNSFHIEPLDHDHRLIRQKKACSLCSQPYQRGDWIRRLPCKHRFHRQCIDEHLSTNSSSGNSMVCPLDGKILYNPRQRQQNAHRCANDKAVRNEGGLLFEQGNNRTAQSLDICIAGRRLGMGKVPSEGTTPASSAKSSGSIKKGMVMSNSLPYKTSSETAANVEAGLSLLATPILSRFNERERNKLTISNQTVLEKPSYKKSNKLYRGRCRAAMKKVSPIRSPCISNDSSSGTSLPKLILSHDNHMIQERDISNALSISTIQVSSQSNRLPPIDAHLKPSRNDP